MIVRIRHKATGRTFVSSPIAIGGVNYSPDMQEVVQLAVKQLRRDGVVDISNMDEFEFEVREEQGR